MSDSDWSNLETVILAGSVEDIEHAHLPSTASVIVVDCPEPHAALLVLVPRTSTPLIVLADVSARMSALLVAAGADDVLPSASSFREVSRAARHAAARRRRAPGSQAANEAGFAGDGGASSAPSSPRVESTAVPPTGRATVRPRNGGPADMPPQLQAVGRLAGGVAHDFNNLLQVIGGSAEQLVHDLDLDDPRRAAAQTVVDASRRAATLTHQLLAFGRRQTLISTRVDLSALVRESAAHLRSRLGPQVEVKMDLAVGLPPVHADRSQLLEVLSSLADNAGDAMRDGGTLSVSTSVVEADEALRRSRPWLRPGRYVQMRVVDTGIGIEAEHLPHLFEPFFSTKGQEGATGLGLSSVYGVVKQTGGFVWVESEPGRGTCVTVLLPPADAVEPSREVPPEGSRARVLLVEDDDSVRELLVGVLAHYGYRVQACASAEEAREYDGPFDLLLSDVLLPGMNGPDLAREMRRTRPGVPVLLMSGDTGHVVDPNELDARGFLQKPFSAKMLVSRVEELLSAARDPKGRDRSSGR